MPRPRIEATEDVAPFISVTKHERMSIVMTVGRETQSTPEPYHKPCLSSPTEPTKHLKIEGLIHADLADMHRGTVIFTRKSRCVGGPNRCTAKDVV